MQKNELSALNSIQLHLLSQSARHEFRRGLAEKRGFFLACGKRKPLSDYEKLIERARKRGCGYWQVRRVFFLSTIKATPCTSVKKQPGVKRRPAIDTDFSESICLCTFSIACHLNLNMTFLLFGEPKIVIIYQDKLSKQMPFQAIRSVILWKIWPRINT